MAATSRNHVLRLGARGSLLSRRQSQMVAEMAEAAHPEVRVELVIVTTSGDRIQDRPLHEFGGKGLFTKELEQALLRHEIDFAVHSYKDMPVTMPLVATDALMIAAVPPREDARDVWVSKQTKSPCELATGARVGTGSLRRQAQVLAVRPDVEVAAIRGNVDTRIGKLHAGAYDAVILAMAGVKRAGFFDPSVMTPLETDVFLPAAGQGALALQCRKDADGTIAILAALNDSRTALAVAIEREVVRLLNGDCHSPIAALAMIEGSGEGERVTLEAAVARRDGRPPVVRGRAMAMMGQADALAGIVVEQLRVLGAEEMLAEK